MLEPTRLIPGGLLSGWNYDTMYDRFILLPQTDRLRVNEGHGRYVTHVSQYDITRRVVDLVHITQVDVGGQDEFLQELSYLLFLKLNKELGMTEHLPKGYRWDDLLGEPESNRLAFYRGLLIHVGEVGSDFASSFFSGASTHLQSGSLDEMVRVLDSMSCKDGFGEVFDELLANIAGDPRIGMFFTPRPLVESLVSVVDPKLGERIADPAMGTAGFLVAAHRHMWGGRRNKPGGRSTLRKWMQEPIFGREFSPSAFRLAVINLWLHGIYGDPQLGDSLTGEDEDLFRVDVVLAGLPFGSRPGQARLNDSKLRYPTSNVQYAFLQRIYEGLAPGGRAAVVVPDSVLFDEGLGRRIRVELMDRCDLHTVLRLPVGIFYAQGVKASVLFFTRRENGTGTRGIWVYDMRTDAPSYSKRNPVSRADFADFELSFGPDPYGSAPRQETKRFRYYSREEIRQAEDSLDLATQEASMLTKLRLERFKNFADAELHLGPLTLLVGTNAAGKSNIRDALRFLHGVSRGYSLAEIIGEKWVEGGVLQWRGIRGGTREVTFQGMETFALEATFLIKDRDELRQATYRIEVNPGAAGSGPGVIGERLAVQGRGQFVFDTHPNGVASAAANRLYLPVTLRKEGRKGYVGPTISFLNTHPVLSQIQDHPEVHSSTVREFARLALRALSSMRFLDLEPEKMRSPSFPGQVVLGDRGENLSSVLQAICQDEGRKQGLLEWVRELTPLDVTDLVFRVDLTGQILVYLMEESGHHTSAYSASDGTLRFLAMIAALLGPEPARLYFFEELENGIHPTRLHLLLQLIEQKVSQGGIQIVATSHSPQLLGFLSETGREAASLIYRLPGHTAAQTVRILDIPDAKRILAEQNLARLHASGWLEDAVALLADEEAEA